MKYLSLLLLVGCYAPKFSLGDKVKFVVPKFYKKVCKGVGVIDGYTGFSVSSISYKVNIGRLDGNYIYCPENFDVDEDDILGKVK